MVLFMYVAKVLQTSDNVHQQELINTQMSEEIHNPSLVVPRSILLSVIINGTLGFAMLIALLFCVGDLDNALNTPTGYPFMEIFLQATRSVGGSAALASIVTVLALCATVGLLASTSRMFWAFARDRGLPGWKVLEQVSMKSSYAIGEYEHEAR